MVSSSVVETELPTSEGPSLYAHRVIAGRYEILSQLGRGGMGEVWRAYDVKLRVDVALKFLRRITPGAVEALRREVRTAREVISPNVCRIFDLVEAEQELISMEYVDGITLLALLVQKGPMPLREARDLAAQFLAGLEAIHQAGLVHRDLKPENIMITRTGRVVVMDFGIAKEMTQVGGTVSGTLPYMSPEQRTGEKVDARSDVFSVGVILAEMIHPEGILNQKIREGIWNVVHTNPLRLADSPWKTVIVRAVAANPEDRFPSAGALSRALEEVTQRIDTIEERKPYPGLASFSTADAEYFFGRELEVETVIKKLQQLHLMALVGASGSGKTSFLRAGLIPALPAGWKPVFTVPGDAPFLNLGQALVPEFSGDTEAMQKMLQFDDLNVLLWLLNRWRRKHDEALLIIDRFEELFTLNSTEVQRRYAEFLGKIVLEADVRVLLAMRDDFLLRCHDYAALSPIFSELTPLGPLSDASLRRALVQPALKAGYRLEDEELISEILADVQAERGALPLMAFAAARLWEQRDRDSGLLTREAYKEIGGVAGAFAQHAEQTMDRIGTERQAIVREIFRNLITAQNTRAARDTEELLSVFPEKQAAQEVLRALIDARLLTSFEQQDESGTRRRVEIIHESLLSNWPRLVRWQTQDADSAQLRDELRQAAQLWEQHNRSQDLLWTGTAFREYQLWRERYPGGLTATEEAFAEAMVRRATRRRRQRRTVLAAIFAIVLGVALTLGIFWQQSEVSRSKAVAEAQRAEASKLLAIAQQYAEPYPTAALAYAKKSLELSDTREARLFALRMTQAAPPAIVMLANQKDGLEATNVDFSSDGKWIAVGGFRGAQICSYDGRSTHVVKEYPAQGFSWCAVQFSHDSRRLFTGVVGGDLRMFSVPDGKELAKWKLADGEVDLYRRGKRLFILSWNEKKISVYVWIEEQSKPIWIGELPMGVLPGISDGSVLYTDDHRRKIYIRSLDDWNAPRYLFQQQEEIVALSLRPDGTQFASIDSSGQIRIWSLGRALDQPVRILRSVGMTHLAYDPSGTKLLAYGTISTRPTVHVWDLTAPPGTEPVVLSRSDISERTIGFTLPHLAFHPSGQWVATAHLRDVAFWFLPKKLPRRFAHEGILVDLAFSPDGQRLFSVTQSDKVQSWPLSGHMEEQVKTVIQDGFTFPDIQIDSENHRLAVSASGGRVLVSNLDGTGLRILQGFSSSTVLYPVAFGDHGRLVAAAPYDAPKADKVVRVWDLQSGHVNVLGPLKGAAEGFEGAVWGIKFIDDQNLLVSGREGLAKLNIPENKITVISEKPHRDMALSRDRKFIIVSQCENKSGQAPGTDYRNCQIVQYSLDNNSRKIIQHFEGEWSTVAMDSNGQVLVTGSGDGLVRVGKLSGLEPHIIFGHKGTIYSVAISPDNEWIASAESQSAIFITPMPDLSRPAPQTLPHDQLITKLKSFTNLRVVPDSQSATGWKVETARFPGWKDLPAW